jgi:ABC-type phosphate/phosphonate transport system substrate-binding protein
LQEKKVVVTGAYSSAYALLSTQFADQGIQYHLHFVGGTDNLVHGILAKKYDAGIVRLDTLDSSALSDIRDKFAIILRSAEIPQYPIAAKSSLDANVVTSIRQAFAELSPDVPEDLKILESLQVTIIIAASDADYQDFFDQIKDSPYLH